MKEKENELWPEDKELFERMKDNYISEEEKYFFETVHERQECQLVISGDYYMSPEDNEEQIGIMRCVFDEWVVTAEGHPKEIHVMNLSRFLNINLLDLGLAIDKTMFQWLRDRNYKNVTYNKNLDLM